MWKKTTKFIAILVAMCPPCGWCQQSDFQSVIRAKVHQYKAYAPTGKRWDEDKAIFAGRSKEEVASALIAELGSEESDSFQSRARDNSVRELYKALDLPPTLVCQELEKNHAPDRKASLINVLFGLSSREVTRALIHQLNDRRPAVDPGVDLQVETHALRVCDVACNALVHNLVPNSTRAIGFGSNDGDRDAAIERVLREMKLERTP